MTHRTYVLHVSLAEDLEAPSSASLEEAISLADALGLDVIFSESCTLKTKRVSTLFGTGTLERIQGQMKSVDAGVLFIDTTLTPLQQRNLEKFLSCTVLDRTAVILEIFSKRAMTAEGRLQVKFAQLAYQRTRLVRTWTHLERQRGGFGFMGGPGESQLELDKRMIKQKMAGIKKALAKVKRTRGLSRKARQKKGLPIIALVGYTNAGKSSLFRYLTEKPVFASSQVFATLDPVLRTITLPRGGQAILSDTVGFIANLPTMLIEAFHATLEELREADLILHVRDITHADTTLQQSDVYNVLKELGMEEAQHNKLFEVWNKTDLLTPEALKVIRRKATHHAVPALPLSAKTGGGCAELLQAVEAFFDQNKRVVTLTLPPEEGKLRAWLYDQNMVSRVVRQKNNDVFHLYGTPDQLAYLKRHSPPYVLTF